MRIKILIFNVVALAFCLQGCDYVGEDERFIDLPPVVADRAVLLEDFTGQNCVNCPDAHEVIEKLVAQYGNDKLVAVSIHAGDFAIGVERTSFERDYVGLMSAEGNAINSAYGIDQWPMGVVDMGSPLTVDQWPGAVREALSIPTDVTISLIATLTPEETIEVEAIVKSSGTGAKSLQIWVVEDSIVARQRNTQTLIPDYVHNNVFRAMFFPIEGKAISPTVVGEKVEARIAVRNNDHERWDPRHLRIVAFVFDKKGIKQVTQTKLSTN